VKFSKSSHSPQIRLIENGSKVVGEEKLELVDVQEVRWDKGDTEQADILLWSR
jgi:hypothetical protein